MINEEWVMVLWKLSTCLTFTILQASRSCKVFGPSRAIGFDFFVRRVVTQNMFILKSSYGSGCMLSAFVFPYAPLITASCAFRNACPMMNH